jgi:NAD(P)-dependent dehydrogenase (short-subunit alcohol dehydrogenase family)
MARTLPPAIAAGLDTLLDRTIAPGYLRTGLALRRRLPTWPADPDPGALSGRIAAVTGATSGLGLATAEGLLHLGAEVLLLARNLEKADAVARDLRARVPGARLRVARCDVGDLDDVRRFVDGLDVPHLDVLVHNAGAMPPERAESPQGHELSMAVHLLGPVLMTELLRPRLRGARVLLVTSGGMYGQALRADDPEYRRGDYSPTTSYARSKRAQVELVPLLAERWATDGISLHVTHPGWADTPGVVDSLPRFHALTGPLLRDAAGGADTTVWLAATEPEPAGGRLWHDRRPRPTHLTRRTRTGPGDVDTLWNWVVDALDLDDAPGA